MDLTKTTLALTLSLAMLPGAARASNTLVSPGDHQAVAKSSIGTTSVGEWNRLGRNEGPATEIWTRDGDGLNKIMFFGGIAAGMPIFKETNRKATPLPKVAANMLLPDIPVLLESTYRSRYQVNRIAIDSQDIAEVGGKQAIRFTYSYVRTDDEVERKGEAVGTLVNGKLYLVTYEAPAIYFFSKDLQDFRHIAQTLKF